MSNKPVLTPFVAEDYLDSIEILKAYVAEIFEDDPTPDEIRSGLETAAKAKCLR